jgi:hypothetical protein
MNNDIPRMANAINELIHAVQVAKKGRLPASRWSNEGRHLALRDIHTDIKERLLGPIEKTEVLYGYKIGATGG